MGQINMVSPRSVHVVDDDSEVRDALALLFTTAQIETHTFPSAEEYLARWPQHDHACVLLDLKLPGLSGMELLKRILARDDAPPVIMITGHGDVPMAVSAMRAGAYDFVEKPFDPGALLTTVNEAFAHAHARGPSSVEIQSTRQRMKLLSEREQDVLDLLAEGLPTKLIAHRLGISPRTAEHHRAAIMQKMRAKSTSHIVRMALLLAGSAPSQT